VRELTYYKGTPVPYITCWEQEVQAAINGAGGKGSQIRFQQLMVPGAPVTASYVDETPADRDAFGALWQRYPLAMGKGAPHFAKVHPARQRRCMTKMLCQVCGNPANFNEQGWQWLVTHEDAARLAAGGDPRVRTANPPVCNRCCDLARELCPHLLKGNALVRTPGFVPWGVYGIVADPAGASPGHTVPYGDPRIHRTLAGQMLVTLQKVQVVDLALSA